MKKVLCAAALVLPLALLSVGCGEKVKQLKDTANAMQEVSKSTEKMTQSMDESQKFMEDRRAKGDTVAMPYADLEKYLPESVNGYKAEGGPSGSKNDMPGMSMSTAEQNYVSTSDSSAHIKVTILDLGGSMAGWAMGSAAFGAVMSHEDDHERAATIKSDVPYTSGYAQYNKDNKDATVAVGTRYRYTITAVATGQKDDQTAMVTDLANSIAKKFDGK